MIAISKVTYLNEPKIWFLSGTQNLSREYSAPHAGAKQLCFLSSFSA